MRSAGKTAGRSRRGILFPGYRLVDAATQAYALTVGILLLVLHDATVPDWKILAAGHGLWILALHGFLRATACRGPRNPPVRRRPVDFLREYYPLLLLPLWFREIGSLNRMLVPEYLDPTLLRWEQAWFGGQASVAWMLRWPSVWVAEFFHTAYFSY